MSRLEPLFCKCGKPGQAFLVGGMELFACPECIPLKGNYEPL